MKRNLTFLCIIYFTNLFSLQIETQFPQEQLPSSEMQFPQEQLPSYVAALKLNNHIREVNLDDPHVLELFVPATTSPFHLHSSNNGQSFSIISQQPRNNQSHTVQPSDISCCSSHSDCCRIRKATVHNAHGEKMYTTLRPYAKKIELQCIEYSTKQFCWIQEDNSSTYKNVPYEQCCGVMCCMPASLIGITITAIPCLLSCTACSLGELTYAAVAYPLNVIRGTVD